MADPGHTATLAPQSIHSTGSMSRMLPPSNCGSSFLGWMQSPGQASTQAASFVPMQGSAITYAITVAPFQLAVSELLILTAILNGATVCSQRVSAVIEWLILTVRRQLSALVT